LSAIGAAISAELEQWIPTAPTPRESIDRAARNVADR
jgi:hypothetical protein